MRADIQSEGGETPQREPVRFRQLSLPVRQGGVLDLSAVGTGISLRSGFTTRERQPANVERLRLIDDGFESRVTLWTEGPNRLRVYAMPRVG